MNIVAKEIMNKNNSNYTLISRLEKCRDNNVQNF